MSKFTLICDDSDTFFLTDSKTTKEFSAESLDEVLENVTQFLRGSGFVFDGKLEVVQDELVSLDIPCCSDSCESWDLNTENAGDVYVTVDNTDWPFDASDIEINFDDIYVDTSELDISEPQEEPKKKTRKRK